MAVEDTEEPPRLSAFQAFFIYFGYGMLFLFGRVRDFFSKLFGTQVVPTPKVCTMARATHG